MVATVSIKMDELLATWLGSENIYENVMRIIESQKDSSTSPKECTATATEDNDNDNDGGEGEGRPPRSPKMPEIPPFFRKQQPTNHDANSPLGNPQNPPPDPPKRRHSSFSEDQVRGTGQNNLQSSVPPLAIQRFNINFSMLTIDLGRDLHGQSRGKQRR